VPVEEEEEDVYVPYSKRNKNYNDETGKALVIPPKMTIKSITNDGILPLHFNLPMNYPQSWLDEFALNEYRTPLRRLNNIDLGLRIRVKTDDPATQERLAFDW